MKKNEIYRAAVSGFTSEGLGVCRVDGCAVFVPNAVPDEEYEIRITHVGRTAAHGRIETILRRSPHRVNRRCPYAKLCGGCDFWHMDYEAECAIKRQRVLDALNRLGGQKLETIELTAAPTCEGYRNKAQFPVAPSKNGAEAGFYKKGTHELIPIDRCLIQPETADLAQNHHILEHGQFIGIVLVEGFAIGSHKEHQIILPFRFQLFNTAGNRLYHHHHACSSAKGVVIHPAVLVGAVIPYVMCMQLQVAAFDCPADNGTTKYASEHFRKQSQYIYSHNSIFSFIRGGVETSDINLSLSTVSTLPS